MKKQGWGSRIGLMWFGLLFFAGITSSLAMGMPWVSFLGDHFNWKQAKAAVSFGLVVLVLGLPTVLFYHQGVFEEYDYWAGTVALVVFALLEIALFSWVFGIKKGWKEINLGADIRIPGIYRFILTYITPLLLFLVLLGSVFTPDGNNWIDAFSGLFHGQGWPLDHSSLISQLLNTGLREEIRLASPDQLPDLKEKLWMVNGSRLLLVAVFAGIGVLVYVAGRKLKNQKTAL